MSPSGVTLTVVREGPECDSLLMFIVQLTALLESPPAEPMYPLLLLPAPPCPVVLVLQQAMHCCDCETLLSSESRCCVVATELLALVLLEDALGVRVFTEWRTVLCGDTCVYVMIMSKAYKSVMVAYLKLSLPTN